MRESFPDHVKMNIEETSSPFDSLEEAVTKSRGEHERLAVYAAQVALFAEEEKERADSLRKRYDFCLGEILRLVGLKEDLGAILDRMKEDFDAARGVYRDMSSGLDDLFKRLEEWEEVDGLDDMVKMDQPTLNEGS
jgi:hypothetical protein